MIAGDIVDLSSQRKKVYWRNGRWLYVDFSDVPHVMHNKLPISVMVSDAVSIERYVMPPHFQRSLRMNTADYSQGQETIVNPWIDFVFGGRPYIFPRSLQRLPKMQCLMIDGGKSVQPNNTIHVSPNSPDLKILLAVWHC